MAEIKELKTHKQIMNGHAVQVLEELLEKAKSGEIRSVMCVAIQSDGTFLEIGNAVDDAIKGLGALTLIHARLTRSLLGG